MSTALIIPAILEHTRSQIDDKIFRIQRILDVQRIQIDFSDGIFTGPATLSLAELPALSPAYTWEAHLMVNQPKNFLEYKRAGFQVIIIHYESFGSDQERLHAIQGIKDLGLTPGLAVTPQTSVELLTAFASYVSLFSVLSVNPGLQGQEFLPASLERVAVLRKLVPHATIEVDGGIRITNVHDVTQAGADYIVVGSALHVLTDDINGNYQKIQTAAQTA